MVTPQGAAPTTGAPRRFRPELQGLRAVAVALVVVYHVWFNRVSGGVDVFFLLTGFLLTGQLSRAAARGTVPVLRQWARTLARLLPAALVVLLATVVAGVLVLPESRWTQTVREVLASGVLLENWQLVAASTDYAARNDTASVVQHFWSLSIQAQVMLAAPVLMVLVARSAAPRAALAVTLGGVAVGSLLFSVVLTALDQPVAYFHTLTRLWEFALGGLLALVIDRVVLPARVRVLLGWVGLVGLVACGLVLQVNSVFPGYAALWPTGCAALVLLAGRTGLPHAADRLLTARPLRRLGDLSYALYLWHWPVLVMTLVFTRSAQLELLPGLAVIGASLVLAVLTHRLVERPLAEREGRWSTGRIVAAGLAVLVAVTAAWQLLAVARTVSDGVVGDDRHPGAVSVDVAVAGLLPPPAAVTEDWVRVERWDCAPLQQFPTEVCTQPVDAEPTRRVVLVGDSHVQQFAGALEPIARSAGWQLSVILLGACPYSTASEVDPGSQGCLDWGAAAAAEIAALQPDAVVTLASRDVRPGLTEQTPTGFVDRWWELNELGIAVLAVRDNPRFDSSPADCLEQLGRRAPECGVPRDAVYAPDPPYLQHDVPPNVSFLDLADVLCGDVCPAEMGNVLVYMDDNHLTATFAASLAPVIEEQVHAAIG
jgi:peptidoglycan/LPS O-acetylase OafA/YrhL